MKLSPSILSADFTQLGAQVQCVDKAGADYIHLDVMDGQFVPNISFGMPVIQAVRKVTEKPLDVHLMIEEPIRYLQEFKDAGADIVTVHAESCKHLHRTITRIRELDMKAGVALNPATSVNVLNYIFDDIDMVLVMSVNPGFGGQKLIPYTIDKIRALRHEAEEAGIDLNIGIDGGVTLENVKEIKDAGANFFIAGSAVFRPHEKMADHVKAFHEILHS